MKKKNIILAAGLAALMAVGATTALTVTANGGLGKVFASITTNEYGCESNCTGEYYPSDLSRRIKANPSLAQTKNVRVIARVSDITTDKGHNFYQDITNTKSYKETSEDLFRNNYLIRVVGEASGYKKTSFKVGDTVAFFGELDIQTMSFGRWSADVVVIKNPTFYQWGDQKDLSLLPDVVYLQ